MTLVNQRKKREGLGSEESSSRSWTTGGAALGSCWIPVAVISEAGGQS
jgi:hypothetical protein